MVKIENLTASRDFDPVLGSASSAAYDIKTTEAFVLEPRTTKTFATGLKIIEMNGYVGLVCSRSGLSAKQEVAVLNAPGIIDPDYKGELKVILHNFSNWPVRISIGDRIGQILFVKAERPTVVIKRELDTSFGKVIAEEEVKGFILKDRGENGFGSTDKS